MVELKVYINKLSREGLNLLIIKNKKRLYASKKDGMTPLLEAINLLGLPTLVGTTVIDKIVGKAAALLICYFKAKEVYTKLLSKSAIEVLEKHGIGYKSEIVVENIRKRDGTDICPFEKIVLEIEDPEEGYETLSRELTQQRNC